VWQVQSSAFLLQIITACDVTLKSELFAKHSHLIDTTTALLISKSPHLRSSSRLFRDTTRPWEDVCEDNDNRRPQQPFSHVDAIQRPGVQGTQLKPETGRNTVSTTASTLRGTAASLPREAPSHDLLSHAVCLTPAVNCEHES
jgi:hypothetical protein